MHGEYTHKLIEIGAQTTADALLLALGGYILSKALERYKASQAIRVEIAKIRVVKIEEVWRAMFELENSVSDYYVALTNCKEIAKSDKNDAIKFRDEIVKPLLDKSNRAHKSADSKIDENQFWLGEAYSKKMNIYASKFRHYADACSKDSSDAIKIALREEMEKARVTVHDFLRQPDL